MTGLDVPAPMQNILERLAKDFQKSRVEPISCFELASRQEGDYWLRLRHKGEQGGAGIVPWKTGASHRFGTRSPAIQALDMVTEHGGLTPDQRSKITDSFPVSTLQRFVEDKAVRKALGLSVKAGKLTTSLAAPEVIKPLKRIVLDLATKTKRVGSLMKTDQMLEYVSTFDKESAPDLSKVTSAERTVDEIPTAGFGRQQKARRRKPDPSDRREVVPKGCPVNVTDNRIADIFRELRTLKLDDAPNAIAVLLRVFLEMSVDHFLEEEGVSLRTKPAGGSREIWKTLGDKLAETVAILVKHCVPKDRFDALLRDVNVTTSPMNTTLLHKYVHDRFQTPSPTELKAAWDRAQRLFGNIWP
jgi:hypothetical protein